MSAEKEEDTSTTTSIGGQTYLCTDEICTPLETDSKPSQDTAAVEEGKNDNQQAESKDSDTKADAKRRNKEKKNVKTSSSMKQLHTQHELDALLQDDGPEIVIVEFVTSWCGACKSIQSHYEQLASQQDTIGSDGLVTIQATQVMCDKNKETKKFATALGVKSYPVFFVYQNGRESTRWNGADVGKLEKAFDGGGSHSKKKGGKQKKKR
jgi:thiol:disulfide interchange protein